MAITLSLRADGTLFHDGDGQNDIFGGDQYFQGQTRFNDVMRGRGGNDNFSAGVGTNTMFGMKGDDSFLVGLRNTIFDRAYGGDGNDDFLLLYAPLAGHKHIISGGDDFDRLTVSTALGSGIDLLKEYLRVNGTVMAKVTRMEQLDASSGDDTIRASGDLLIVNGNQGNDRIWANATLAGGVYSGGAGNDSLRGSDERDTLFDGDPGLAQGRAYPNFYGDIDLLDGGGGNDELYSFSGNDTMRGGDGFDTFHSVNGRDTILGGADGDLVLFYYGTYVYQNGADRDRMERAQSQLDGLTIDLGSGHDAVRFWNLRVSGLLGDQVLDMGVEVNLGRGMGHELGTGQNRSFVIRNVEDVSGTIRKDTLIGSGVSNHLYGERGNDTLRGRGGNDIIEGGKGNDTLFGGAGNDIFRFVFREGKDRIRDFEIGKDMIDFSRSDYANRMSDLTLSDSAAGVVIVYSDNGDQITLSGLTVADLSATDFDFG